MASVPSDAENSSRNSSFSLSFIPDVCEIQRTHSAENSFSYCSSDYQNGIFIKSPDVVQLLWNQFISYKEQCSLFFRPAPLTPENHKAVIDSMFDTFYDQNDLIGIQPEPCLTPFFTGNLLHEIFNYDLPQADAILAAAEQAFQMNMVKIQNEQFLIYSTREGLLQFAKTGLTDEIPEIFYHPLTVEQRIEILNGVRQCCETGVYRFLQKPLSHLPHNLHFCIRGLFAVAHASDVQPAGQGKDQLFGIPSDDIHAPVPVDFQDFPEIPAAGRIVVDFLLHPVGHTVRDLFDQFPV